MKLKGEMSMLNVLQLQNADIETLCKELQQKVEEAPQFFVQSPLVIDFSEVVEGIESINFSSFKSTLLDLGFIPVGIRNIPNNMNKIVADAGWAIMRDAQKSKSNEKITETEDDAATQRKQAEEKQAEPKVETTVAETKVEEEQVSTQNKTPPVIGMKQSVTVDRTVRSGQQIYAANADMTVLAATSSGSELMADGSIHIYGSLRGRVLAGARGDESARIYCQSLQAELFAIAGRYQLLDESDTHLKGKPVMIRLEGESLVIEALN